MRLPCSRTAHSSAWPSTAGAEQVKRLVDEVQVGSQEQARGLDQISNAVSQMEQLTQKSAASAEESASASEQLTAQADTLRSVVGDLIALVGATGGATASAALNFKAADAKPTMPDRSKAPRGGVPPALPKVKDKPDAVAAPRQPQEFPLDESFKEV